MEDSRHHKLGICPTPEKATAFAQYYIKQILRSGDTAIDATCGNGHDTLFLEGLTGSGGKVLALDIQEQAISQTHARLTEQNRDHSALCLRACHSNIKKLCKQHLAKRPRAIMFNFGYLPGGDKSIITQAQTSFEALLQSWQILAPSGILSTIVYPGHSGGDIEADIIREWVSEQKSELTLRSESNRPEAPQAILMIK